MASSMALGMIENKGLEQVFYESFNGANVKKRNS